MEKTSKKVKNKLVKGKPFLNDFHKKNTEKALKSNESAKKHPHSWQFMKDQSDWLENRFKES